MRMMLSSVSALTLLCLACSPLPDIERGMNGLVGKPIDAAVAKLGRPQDQRPNMGETSYIWSTSYEAMGITPTYTSGAIGSAPVVGASYTIGPAGQADCTLRVFAKADVITGWDVDGNARACRRYAESLR